MNDEIIVWEMPDRTVCYATCAHSYKKPGETRTQWLLRAFNKTVKDNPQYAGAKRILNPVMPDRKPLVPGPDDHPVEHAFMGAWRHLGGGNIAIDMPKARALKLTRIRAERDGRFPPLDAEWMKATGQKKSMEADAIEARRQHLRELPQTVDLEAIATPETLAAFDPDWEG